METQAITDRVVEALEAEGLLAPADDERSRAVVERALAADEAVAARRPEMPKLVEVVAYFGGALVLASGFLFMLQTWDDLGDVGQVSFLAAVALVLGIAGAVTARGQGLAGGAIRRRLGGTLLTASSLAGGFAVGVAVEVFTDLDFDDVYWPVIAGGLAVAAGSALAYRLASTAVGLVGILGGVVAAGSDAAASLASAQYESLGVGSAFFAIGAGWLFATELGVFDQRTIARTLGLALTVFGGQAASFNEGYSWIGYLMMVVIAAGGVWLYLTRLDWPFLAAAVISVTLVVPEAVSDWTEGSLGVVGGVLVAGITLLVASYAGYRLRKEATD